MKKMVSGFMCLAALCGFVLADYTPASKQDALNVATAQSVTNGQAVTISAGLNVLTGIANAVDGTNTVTLAAPDRAGILAVIAVGSSTNLIGIADSGTAALSAAFIGDANDTLTLISVSTSTWAKVTGSAN